MQSGNHGGWWVSGVESGHSRKYFPSVNNNILRRRAGMETHDSAVNMIQ